MLRKPKTITSNKTAPKSLKPQKARQLIRRFHNLQKWKQILLRKLQKQYPDIDEKLYVQTLGSAYTALKLAFKLPKTVDTNPYPSVTDKDAPVAKLVETVAKIDAEISARGGLHVYQMASTVGQDSQRGGDSLKWLVKWFEKTERKVTSTLEIGCLSAANALLKGDRFGHVTRIDLNSQSPQILQQDFMERPLPKSNAEKFDVISCSLVLNFVPSPLQRGDMLRRMTKFLRDPTGESKSALFFVLPLPCLSNSRYFDRECLGDIMQSLGFEEIESHEAKKVIYLLYNWNGKKAMKKLGERKKKELHPGPVKNNFYVAMS